MGIKVFVFAGCAAIFDFDNMVNIPDMRSAYIGHIAMDSFEKERDLISDERIKQFLYISCGHLTIFNRKQSIVLEKELEIIEGLNIINKPDMKIIKEAVKLALEENLYVRFYYD